MVRMAQHPQYTYRRRPPSTQGGRRLTAAEANAEHGGGPRPWLVALIALVLVACMIAGLVRGCADDDAPGGALEGGDPTDTTLLDEDIVLTHPTYLGGASRGSSGPGPAPDRLDVIWRVEIGTGLTERLSDGKLVTWSGTGWTGQPTLVHEQGDAALVIGGYDHGLRRIDAMTGEVVWRAELDDVIKGTNTVYYDPTRPAGDRLVVVTGSRRGNGLALGDPAIAPLRGFSFATGTELWRLPVPRTENYSQDVDASPLMVDGRLIAAVEPGYVFALDTSTLASGPAGHPMPTIVASSPALYDAADITAHVQDGGSNLVLEGSPAVLGDRIYICSSAGHVYGLDRRTLALEWDFACGGDLDSTVVVTPDGLLLVGLERQYVKHGGVFLLDPSKNPAESVVWFFPTLDRGIGEWAGGVIGSVAIGETPGGEPIAAFTSVDGNLYVVSLGTSADTGAGPDGTTEYPTPRVLFSDSLGGSISTPAIVGDRIVAAGLDKQVHLYEMTTEGDETAFAEIALFEADGPFESTPLVWNERVYIGCRDGYLYCLGEN